MQVGVSFWPACTKGCMSSLKRHPYTNAAVSMMSRGQTLHKHGNTAKRSCCKLCLVQQLFCQSCKLICSAVADYAASAVLYCISDLNINPMLLAGMTSCWMHVVYKNKRIWRHLSLSTSVQVGKLSTNANAQSDQDAATCCVPDPATMA